MVLRILQRWRFAPGPAILSVAAYAFVILSLCALAAQATGRLAGMVAKLAPALTASSPQAKTKPDAPQKAAMSVPQSRSQGSVILTQGWGGYGRDRSYWRDRDRERDSWRRRDRDDDDDWRWRDSDEDGEGRRSRDYSNTYRTV